MFLLDKSYWEVRTTKDKGRGIFATKDIPARVVVGDYIGIVTLDSDVDEQTQGLYDMHFNDTASIVANPKDIGVHLLNHSCAANCGVYPYKGHAVFFALRHIFPGEELTISYLLEPPGKNHICNHACFCGSPICHGTMHTSIEVSEESDSFVAEKELEFPSVLSVSYGELLPPLQEYPQEITDDMVYDIFGSLSEPFASYPDAVLPAYDEIRKRIRDTGKRVWFAKIGLGVYGFMNGLLIGMQQDQLLTR